MNTLKLIYRVPRTQRMTLMAVSVFLLSFAMYFAGLGPWTVYMLALASSTLFFLPDLVALISTFYLHDNQAGIALKLCKLAIDLEPDNYNSLVNCGVAYLKLHEPKDAVQLFDRAIAIDGKKALAFSNRSFAYHLLKDFKSSERDALKATELKPDANHGHLNYTAALIGQARYADALERLNNLPSPGRYREHVSLQRLLCKVGLHRTEEAELEWKNANIKSPFFQHFAKCYIAWNKADYPEVLSLSSEYHDTAMQAETILYFRAISYSYLGESEMAYKAAYTLYMQKPHQLLGMEAMLVILVDTTFDTIALDLADRVEDLHPNSFTMILTRLLLAMRSGDLALAQEWMTKLETASPHSMVAKSYKALLALKNSKIDEAIALAEEATKWSPKEAIGWYALSKIQLAQGKATEALSSIKTALELQHYNHNMYAQLAEVHKALGQVAEEAAAQKQSQTLSENYNAGVMRAMRERPLLFIDTDSGVAFDTLLAMDKSLK